MFDNGGVVGGTFPGTTDAALGANFQAGAFVFGIEGDWDYSAINTGTTASICTFSGQCQTGNNWLATVRGRAGYAADRVLLYLTGGGAFANVQTNFMASRPATLSPAGLPAAVIEWVFADNWTAKVEYLFVNLGNGSVNCATNTCLIASGTDGVHPNGPAIPVSVSLTENLFRVGVNYKFNF